MRNLVNNIKISKLAAVIIIMFLNNCYISTIAQNNNKPIVPIIRIQGSNVKSGSPTDMTVVYFINDATSSYDPTYDGKKLLNTDPKLPNIYTLTPEVDSLAINGLPEVANETVVPLCYDVRIDGSYAIIASEIKNFAADTKVVLEDRTLGIFQDLITNNSYNFNITTTEKNRFFLHFTNEATTTNIINNTINNLVVYTFNKDLYINNPFNNITVTVFNINGQKVSESHAVNAGSFKYDLNSLKSGYYTIKIEGNSINTTKKVFVG